ncbi:prepilin-type N-terminal cleavage/methylation domain-containing protein [Duganella sp. FT50W]|uniref:Prepilin-type N-terminal cleavage/methylation domain-containing protein n=1 Tax=Duganella lactea TaxID=2692173 RepID=A0A6L8MQT4_9BURK|nr:prepilin-type N-terminal cleavage/methylation domain-containing protein [Duganella lactea]
MRTGLPVSRAAGFTMVELITVIVLMGILGAIGASRFFNQSTFESRAYADQAKTILRYAQKLAITQNRYIFVRTDGNSFAVCTTAACGAGSLISAPGGSNSGSSVTRASCLLNNSYNANWLCEGRPSTVNVTGLGGSSVVFDALGRPYTVNNGTQALLAGVMTITFTNGSNSSQITVWPETGYVQ